MFSDPAGGCVDAVGWGGVGGKDKFLVGFELSG